MPEELSLPGIDPAPAAPAAPPPSPAAEDTATQSASVDTGAQAPPEEPPVEPSEQVAQKREARGVQKRLNELAEDRRIANERADRSQALLEQMVKGILAPPQGAQPDPMQEQPPRKEDYPSWEEFSRAETRYFARQEARQELTQRAAHEQQQRRNWETQQAQQATAVAVQQLEGVVGSQLQEAAPRYPDYMEVIEACPVKVPVNVQAAMAMSGQAGDVGYYLARNPALIGKLAGLPDMALAYQVNRIAGHMRSSTASVSNAPTPGRPVSGRGSGQVGYPENATPQQHMAWRKAQAARK